MGVGEMGVGETGVGKTGIPLCILNMMKKTGVIIIGQCFFAL